MAGLAQAQEKDDWIPLFNGKDLTGWIPKIRGYAVGENFGNTFRVENGLLTVSYDQYEGGFRNRFGHLFYEQPFENYLLRAEYRFIGDQAPEGPGWAFRNSGLMIHGQDPQTMPKNQDFPVSIEVQLLGGRKEGQRTNANLCTPGTNVVMEGKLVRRHCTSSRSKTYREDRWVTVIVEVRGRRIKHWIEGEEQPVLAYDDPQLDPRDANAAKIIADRKGEKLLTGGTISLQSESHPIQFRKVEIKPLDEGFRDLLADGGFAKHWTTKGNWVPEAGGIVTLVPREGERGWARFDDYLWLEGEYADFEFTFEARMTKRSNSGFYFRVSDRKSPVRHGIEVQLYESHSRGKDARLTDHDAGGIIPGVPPKVNAAKPAGEWNRYHIRCVGDDLTVMLNGVLVNQVKLNQGPLASRQKTGSIGFQDHALRFSLRNIKVRTL